MTKAVAKIDYDQATYDAALTQLWKEVDTFETYLAQREGAFLVNDEITIADLQIFFEFQNLIYVGLDKSWEEKYPQVTAWYNAVINVPAVKGLYEKWIELVAPFIKLLNQ